MRWYPLVSAIGFLLAFSRVGSADELVQTRERDPHGLSERWSKRPIALLAHGGMTPAGGLGGSVEITPLDALSVEAGVGATVGGGAKAAVLPRGRLFLTPGVAIGAGAGLSLGQYRETSAPLFCLFDCPPSFTKSWTTAAFADALVDLEGRTRGGFVWRVFGGAGWMLNPGEYACSGTVACPKSAGVAPYLGASLGYAFNSRW